MKYPILAASAIVACLGFQSCDNVPEEGRFEPNEGLDKPQDPRDITRNILIEEFTGQWCTNCPDGAATIHRLQEDYPGQIIAVSLHPEGTSYTRPLGPVTFTNPIATALYKHYSPSAFPAAVINGAAPVTNMTQWASIVYQESLTTAPAEILLLGSIDQADNTFTVEYNVSFGKDYAGSLNLSVWLVENKIQAPQIVGGTPKLDYEHNHALRTSFTSEWGIPIGDEFENGQEVKGSVSGSIDPKWNLDNCQIVAFIANPSSKEVIQANAVDALTPNGVTPEQPQE